MTTHTIGGIHLKSNGYESPKANSDAMKVICHSLHLSTCGEFTPSSCTLWKLSLWIYANDIEAHLFCAIMKFTTVFVARATLDPSH